MFLSMHLVTGDLSDYVLLCSLYKKREQYVLSMHLVLPLHDIHTFSETLHTLIDEKVGLLTCSIISL